MLFNWILGDIHTSYSKVQNCNYESPGDPAGSDASKKMDFNDDNDDVDGNNDGDDDDEGSFWTR